jgi:hypothetical protein
MSKIKTHTPGKFDHAWREGVLRSNDETLRVLDALIAAAKHFNEVVGSATAAEFDRADRQLKSAITDAELLRKPTKTIKLSGNMVDATDRDLLGNPTLEGDCRL